MHVLLLIYFSKKWLDYMGSLGVLYPTGTLNSLVTFGPYVVNLEQNFFYELHVTPKQMAKQRWLMEL